MEHGRRHAIQLAWAFDPFPVEMKDVKDITGRWLHEIDAWLEAKCEIPEPESPQGSLGMELRHSAGTPHNGLESAIAYCRYADD
ncbi:hypothetical protein [Ensifer adhaerens]|uniref:hypothetical protein n=1 Tax=Ensifer adhaerens TaxID=106592 RepID=UPI001929E797|nr:hypothetical protein [Ensifer adhaerens]